MFRFQSQSDPEKRAVSFDAFPKEWVEHLEALIKEEKLKILKRELNRLSGWQERSENPVNTQILSDQRMRLDRYKLRHLESSDSLEQISVESLVTVLEQIVILERACLFHV